MHIFSQPPTIACAPPLPYRLTERMDIRISILILINCSYLAILHHCCNLQKWLNALNTSPSQTCQPGLMPGTILCAFLLYYPSQVLEMAKYQMMIVMFFVNHAVSQYIEYDRQAVAKDRTIWWDSIKEDNYVWSLTCCSQPFQDRFPIMVRLGSPPRTTQNQPPTSHTPQEVGISAQGSMQPDAPRQPTIASLHMPAGIPTARVHTQARDALPGTELTPFYDTLNLRENYETIQTKPTNHGCYQDFATGSLSYTKSGNLSCH